MDTNYKYKNEQKDISTEQFALMIIESVNDNSNNSDGNASKKDLFVREIAEKIAKIFEGYKTKAVEFLKDAKELEKLLLRVDDKFKSIPKVGDKLAYIPELILLVRSYAIKEYTDISKIEIIAIIAALLYFVSPIDVIPDSIPVAGYLDDALVAGIIVKWCDEDLEKYMEWLNNK